LSGILILMKLLDLAAVDSMLRTEHVGRGLAYVRETASTMDDARAGASSGAPHGTVYLAEEQTRGRGRFGRRWVSPPGKNLYLTILLKPDAERLRRLSMTSPLAICLGVEDVCSLRPSIKWPNDVQVGGRKLAGILIESELSGAAVNHALVGIGLNVNDQIDEPEIAAIATSLARECGRDVAREAVLAALLNEFEELYESGEVFDAWRDRLVTLGQRVDAAFGDEKLQGVAESVDADGSLLLRTPSGELVKLEAGEVSLRS
jgi:BirA family biotin operon repressor/biotin-[acetyl-CoA-carboxylase] ligase